ncbi:MAG: hypothetical protein ACRYGP_08710 [Janthinobacterium lividum]
MNSVASRRSPRAIVALFCCLSGLAGPAYAAAWNRPAGQGLAIFDYSLESGTDYFDGRGHLAPSRSFSKSELAAYVEYGATDSWTLIARPSLDDVRIGTPDAGTYRGLGSSALGAQWQALVFGPAVLAVQGSFLLPGSTSRANPAVIGNTAREGDLRLLGGLGLPLPFRPFLDLEGSYRIRSGGGASQWHGDATFGFYPTDKLLILLQSFTTVPTGPGDVRLPSSRATRLELTGVYALTQSLALQFGVFTTRWGRDALRDHGFTTGVWWYF